MNEWVIISNFAKSAGITVQYARRLIKIGKIPEEALKLTAKPLLINPTLAKKALSENLNSMHQRRKDSAGLAAAKKEHALAKKEPVVSKKETPEELDQTSCDPDKLLDENALLNANLNQA